MSFSTEAWQRADVWYQAVLSHPFIRGLSDGTLAEMLANYGRSARFEWMFWDAAWRGEAWPTPDG